MTMTRCCSSFHFRFAQQLEGLARALDCTNGARLVDFACTLFSNWIENYRIRRCLCIRSDKRDCASDHHTFCNATGNLIWKSLLTLHWHWPAIISPAHVNALNHKCVGLCSNRSISNTWKFHCFIGVDNHRIVFIFRQQEICVRSMKRPTCPIMLQNENWLTKQSKIPVHKWTYRFVFCFVTYVIMRNKFLGFLSSIETDNGSKQQQTIIKKKKQTLNKKINTSIAS